jgi:glycosyltransferase involved in cell wall biosynthesis
MKILKLHERLNNTGGIVSFQIDLGNFYSTSKNIYYHFRTGKVENHFFLSNPVIRMFDLAISYLIYPFYLLKLQPDVIEINSGLDTKSFLRDWLYLKITRGILKRSKIILFMHGWDEDFGKKMVEHRLKSFLNFFNSANDIVVLAEQFKNELIRAGISNQKVYVIRTGLDIKFFKPKEKVQDGIVRILFLARIEVPKGIYEFLNAIPQILEFNPNIIFDIAGSGSIFEEIKNYEIVKKYQNNIQFHGYVNGSEKVTLFQKSTIYVFPSYTEGCPVSILEAMAIGLPLVYTNVGALREIIEDGVNGIMVPIGESEPIVKAVKKLISEPELRKQMGIINRKKAEKDFSIENIFHELENIYAGKK